MNVLSFDRVSYQYPGEDFDIINELSFDVKPTPSTVSLA